MIGFSSLNDVFRNVLGTGLVKEIYHSVIIRNDGTGQVKPSAPVETKFVYVGIDDSHGFRAYQRAVTPLEWIREDRVGGCSPSRVQVRVLNRLVFFSPNETRGHDDLANALALAVIGTPGVRFQRLMTNAEDFIRQEHPTGSFHLSTADFYIAIEFYTTFWINPQSCGQPEIGCGKKNPFCLAG